VPPIRVLVVDDSAAIRRLLAEILASDSQVEVAGSAPNAAIALAKLEELKPDIVTLDVEMPDVSGLELLAQIRKRAPRLPVIMFSSLTQRAAATTLEALALGATDYVTKPAATGSREASIEQVKSQLLPKIKGLGRSGGSVTVAQTPKQSAASPERPRPSGGAVKVLAVGCSTGGPNALASLFRSIPRDFPVPVVIVQHMPPVFTQLLAERLTATCPLKFHEARDGDVLTPGAAWIAPGDHHIRLVRVGAQVKVVLDHGPPENSCRPAVDVLFRSVADVYGGATLALILTGMGQDGLRGCERLHALGARIVVQDESSSVVWGMPGFVARASLADRILPLAQIATEVDDWVRRSAHGTERRQHVG
jgi:two-component system chemotaxis response regulator CheB